MKGVLAAGVVVAVVLVGIFSGSSRSVAQADRPGGTFFDENETTHEPNIEAIARAGITGGCVKEGTAFCPDLPVTRAQMASFLARALLLEPASPSFTDVDPSSVHAANIGAIAAAGITLGCGPGLFCPDDLVTREQMASFLARGLGLTPLATGPFTDVAGTHLRNVNAIAAAGITLGCNTEGTRFCPEREVIRSQMASFLARGLGLEPVTLPKPIHLLGLEGACAGETPACSATATVAGADAYYILEGWFYQLPYAGGDGEAFTSDATSVVISIDGEEVADVTKLPVTDLFGTMVRLEGTILTELEPGQHVVNATWLWDGDIRYRSEVTVTVSG